MKILVLFAAALMLGLSVFGCNTLSGLVDSGGTVYVVEVDTKDPNRAEIIDRVVKILESRMNFAGIDGVASRSGDADNRIEVKINGSPDAEVLRMFLFTTNRLELKKVVSPPSPAPAQTFPTIEKAQERVTTGQQILPYVESEFGPSQFAIVEKEPIVTGEHIRNAQAISYTGSDADYQISFTLNKDGAAKLGQWTNRNIHNYIAVVLDDKIQSVAYIKSQITDQGEISGVFTKAEAEGIARSLKSGYMPAMIRVIEERQFK
jgi:preprotein translocase subunit SecD